MNLFSYYKENPQIGKEEQKIPKSWKLVFASSPKVAQKSPHISSSVSPMNKSIIQPFNTQEKLSKMFNVQKMNNRRTETLKQSILNRKVQIPCRTPNCELPADFQNRRDEKELICFLKEGVDWAFTSLYQKAVQG